MSYTMTVQTVCYLVSTCVLHAKSEAHQRVRENSYRACSWAGHKVPRDMNGACNSARRWGRGRGHMTWFTGQRHMTRFTGQGHMTWFTGQTITGSGWKHCSQTAQTQVCHKQTIHSLFSFAFAGTCCGIYKAQDCGLHSISSGRSARAAHKKCMLGSLFPHRRQS